MHIRPHLVQKPWGGDFLARHYNDSLQNIGEAWLLSTLEEGESRVGEQTLSEVLGQRLSYLVKVLDTSDHLSVQVHPDDKHAQALENSRGKTECWLILATKENGGVYLGLKDGVSSKDFKNKVLQGESVEKLMQFYPVKRGDFISVPAGTIHAIGAGVTLLEVQQSSGITYRLWDWGRPGRELHLEKGLKVSNFEKHFTITRNVFDQGPQVLMRHSDFNCAFDQSQGEGWYVDLKTLSVSTVRPQNHFVFVW